MGFARSSDGRFGYYDTAEEYRRAVQEYDRTGGQGPYPVFSPASVASGGRPTRDVPGSLTGTDILLGKTPPGTIGAGFAGAGQPIPKPGQNVPGINIPYAPGTIDPGTGTVQPGPPRKAPTITPSGRPGPVPTVPDVRQPTFPTTQKPQTVEDFLKASPQRLRAIIGGKEAPVTPQTRGGMPTLSAQDEEELLPTEQAALNAGLLKMGMTPEDYRQRTRRLFGQSRGGF